MTAFFQHNLYALAGLLQICLSLMVAQSITRLGTHKKGNIEFIRFMNYSAAVGLCYTLRALQPSVEWFMIIEQFLLAPFIFFLPFFYLHFVARFSDWDLWEKKAVRAGFILPCFILLAVNFIAPHLLYTGAVETPYGFTVKPGAAANGYALYSLITGSMVIYLFWRRFNRTSFERSALYIIIAGNLLAILTGMVTDIILPQYFQGFPTLSFAALNLYTICLWVIVKMNQGLFNVERALIDFERLKFFNKTSSALNEDIHREELLQMFVDNARKAAGVRSVLYVEITPPDRFRLAQFSGDEKSVIPQIIEHARQHNYKLFNQHSLKDIRVGFIDEAIRTGEMQIVKSIHSALGEVLPFSVSTLLQFMSGVKCYAALPVKVMNETRGILLFSLTREETDFTIYHLFTNQCAQILRNFELLNSYRTARDEQAILLNNIATQIWYFKDKDTFGRVNTAFAAFHNLDARAIEGRPVEEVLQRHPGLECLVTRSAQVFETRQKVEFEEWLINHEGRKRILLITQAPKLDAKGEVEYVVCVGNDLTDFRKMESQLNQSQKMEAIGQLAGGVAHNFNNLLLSIMGYAELIGGEGSDPRIAQFANRIIMASQHGSNLSQQLLTFARKGKYEVRVVDMNKVTDEVISLIQNTFDKKIRIRKDFSAGNPNTSGDPTQLMQMLLNLALNARDAMPGGGQLNFMVGQKTLDDAFCKKHDFALPGRYLHLSVNDTGTGIPKDVLPHLFEPFFTTKEIGKGFGLGLASVYGCVKNHGGYITVESREGEGTTFDIYLPLAGETPEQEKAPAVPDPKTTHQGRIMIIEDEEDVRTVTALTLRKAGYTIQSFGNGPSAIAFYKENSASVDVVMLDITMPEMNGLECMQALMAVNPQVLVIIASGHTFEGEPRLLVEKGAKAFIQKPWKRAELVRVIDEVITKQ